MSDWLIYGASGYTGRLIAREAAARGLKPTLAGRNRAAIEKLAQELACPFRVFALDEGSAEDAVAGVKVVLNCAGPFSQTAAALVEWCMLCGTSYLDITGEIDVIEMIVADYQEDRRAHEVSLIPAVGFDVVPTDCVAAMLAAELPDATHLALAFHGTGEVSPGTAKTALEGAIGGGRARVDGKITSVPFAWKTRVVPFADGNREAQTIPWGDVASAFYTTGIPNIETYLAMRPADAARMRRLSHFAPLLRIPGALSLLKKLVDRTTPGPDEAELQGGRTEIWGEVRNAAGRSVSMTLTTPNAYRLTVLSALAAVERVLQGNVPRGFQTPARAFGKEFVLSLPGVSASVPKG